MAGHGAHNSRTQVDTIFQVRHISKIHEMRYVSTMWVMTTMAKAVRASWHARCMNVCMRLAMTHTVIAHMQAHFAYIRGSQRETKNIYRYSRSNNVPKYIFDIELVWKFFSQAFSRHVRSNFITCSVFITCLHYSVSKKNLTFGYRALLFQARDSKLTGGTRVPVTRRQP